MTTPDSASIRLHGDPVLFRETVAFTAAETGFAARLIEKDYFCTVLLQYLAATAAGDLVFRGGTCLSKVHAGFYRLSEDLDFVIPTPIDATRAQRRARTANLRDSVARLGECLPGFRVTAPLRGANYSSHYIAVVAYSSLIRSDEGTIQIEVSLREPLLTSSTIGQIQTLLLDPITGASMVPVVPFPCLSQREMIAEKLRAALSRRDAAIRDFYDIDHAVRSLGLDIEDSELVALVQGKLAVPGNEPVDVSPARLAVLRPQVEAELEPVLLTRDFAGFDLERAFGIVSAVAANLAFDAGDSEDA